RDDLSGMQLSGNKVRKLEFLMADAVAQGADCIITIGGIQSNHCRAAAVAAKGYIEAIKEIEQQLQTGTGGVKFDDIVVACGSGGTIAGLSLGSWLGTLKAKVHAFSVCDLSKGLGYAINTSEELNFVKDIAAATGVVLDPVYSGKAAYGMLNDMAQNPKKWEGRKVLFVHTGGLLGLFDKVDQMAPLLKNWSRMDVHESVPRKDGTGKMF
ncbi:hypothetical protein CUMW_177110, partial [Citrus unshiu]